jgi:hypothetical protein
MPDLTEQIADRLASLFTVAELTQWLVSPPTNPAQYCRCSSAIERNSPAGHQ